MCFIAAVYEKLFPEVPSRTPMFCAVQRQKSGECNHVIWRSKFYAFATQEKITTRVARLASTQKSSHLFNTQLPLRNPSAPIQNAQINQYIQQLEHSPPIARFNRLNSHQVSTSSPASSSTRLLLRPPLLNVIEASKKEIKMASDEIEQSQSGVEEMGVGGPGAPTPLSALEVCTSGPPMTIVSYCT